MSKSQKQFRNLTPITVGPNLGKLNPIYLKQPPTSLKKLEFNSNQKTKVARLNE